jgi:ketosteroid isomerase-like protein
MDAVDLIRLLMERIEDRDWAGVTALVDPDAVIDYPRTGESFHGSSWVAVNRDYPEGWALRVREVVGGGERAVSDLEVTMQGLDGLYVAQGFWTVRDGRVVAGREYWSGPDLDEAPAWRTPYQRASVAP